MSCMTKDSSICAKPAGPSRFRLPVLLVGIHTAMVIVAIASGGLGRDFIAGRVWVLFGILDCPASWLVWQWKIPPDIFFLGLGILQWGFLGFLIQTGWRWFRGRRRDRL
jgi:hypothetical protein